MSGARAIVAHDAGGAEILSSMVRRLAPEERARQVFVLHGPARAVFERKLGALPLLSLQDALTHAETLLCGSGWQSELELNAIAGARALGKRSTVFLDHWVNYRARFERSGRTTLPDEVWVGDDLALVRAQQELPEVPAQLVPNPYVADLREALATRPDAGQAGTGALFLCEPVREHALRERGDERHWGYTEEDALRYFLDHLQALPEPMPRIVVRLHPSETPGKYDALLARYALPLEVSAGGDLLDDILRSRWVAGCNTMAMVVALIAKRRVLCCIPPGGRPCLLPQPEIFHLRQLVEARR